VMASTIITMANCDAVRRGHPRHQQSLLNPLVSESDLTVETRFSTFAMGSEIAMLALNLTYY
jgi:hypothetical protein